MKNKKLIFVFILIIAILLATITCTKASDDIEELPTIVTGNEENNEEINNAETENTVEPTTNNQEATNNKVEPTNTNNNETLPKTGVQEDTTLFIFIGVCIISAIYAYIRIRKYNNID